MAETESVRTPLPTSVLDGVITAQLAIAWAGEGGETPRLGWWKTDFQSEFGGEDLYRRLLPKTWEWAVFQSVRAAAQRRDAELRSETHEADEILSLFNLGYEIDERVDDRIADLKRSGVSPTTALPGLRDVVRSDWDPEHFLEWLSAHGKGDFTTVPAGRRLKGKRPESLELTISNLLAAFSPLARSYPLPHYRRPT